MARERPLTTWHDSIDAKLREDNDRLRKANELLRSRQTPVDYNAWERGYVPPSEHVLIDELAYRGARVVCSTSGGSSSFWLVVKGELDTKGLSALSRSLHEQFFMLEEATDAGRSDIQAVKADAEVDEKAA